MTYLLATVLLWTGCTLPSGELLFVDRGAICVTTPSEIGPALECVWPNR